MNGLYSYMTESEYNDYKEQVLIESKLARFDSISEMNRLKYEMKLADIDTTAVLENYTADELKEAYESAYLAYMEAEKSLWESIKEYFTRLINAIFGKGLKQEEVKELEKIEGTVEVGPLKKILGYAKDMVKELGNFIASAIKFTIAGTISTMLVNMSIEYGFKPIKNLIDKAKADKSNDKVTGTELAVMGSEAISLVNETNSLLNKHSGEDVDKALSTEVEIKENGETKKVKLVVIIKNAIASIVNFIKDTFAKVTGIGKKALKEENGEKSVGNNNTKAIETNHGEWYKNATGEEILKGEMERWKTANGNEEDKSYWQHYYKTVYDLKQDNKFDEVKYTKHLDIIKKAGKFDVDQFISDIKKGNGKNKPKTEEKPKADENKPKENKSEDAESKESGKDIYKRKKEEGLKANGNKYDFHYYKYALKVLKDLDLQGKLTKQQINSYLNELNKEAKTKNVSINTVNQYKKMITEAVFGDISNLSDAQLLEYVLFIEKYNFNEDDGFEDINELVDSLF